MNIDRKNFARIGITAGFFENAAERSYDKFVELSRVIENRDEPEYDPDFDEVCTQRDIAGVETIVFAAMCFESAIYDYAADHLGDTYVKEHLDKLDVLSKWVLIMRLVAGYEFQKSHAPYAALKGLVSARNKLVHSKSEPFDFENMEKQVDGLIMAQERRHQAIHNAYRAIVLVSVDIEAKLGPLNNPLSSFDPSVALMREIPPNLARTVAECRSTIYRSIE